MMTSAKMYGDDDKVCGMMQVLIGANKSSWYWGQRIRSICHFETKDVVYKSLEDVYHNFTCIHKAAIASSKIRFYGNSYLSEKFLVWAGCLVTFCRWSMNRILEEDGKTINQTLGALLADIELYLLDFVNSDTHLDSKHYLDGSKMKDIKGRICKAYYEPLPLHSHQLIITHDIMAKFLEMCPSYGSGGESGKPSGIMDTEPLHFLRKYFEVLTKGQIPCDHEFLIAVNELAYKLVQNYYVAAYEININVQVLKPLVSQSDFPIMSDDFLREYCIYIQDPILGLKMNMYGQTHLIETSSRLNILTEWVNFVRYLLITYLPSHNSEHDKLSNTIRLHFHALLINVGSLTTSYVENHVIEELNLGVIDLIKKFHVLKGEIIMAICCTILRETERESPKNDQLGSLIILLKNFKELMDRELSSIITWNDHDNLVFFIFYLVQNNIRGGDPTLHLEVDLNMINHEDLNGVLVSAGDVAFKMASYSLLRMGARYLWRELYMNKYAAGLHTCAGILKAIALSSKCPLSHELLIAYGECIQDCNQEGYIPFFDGYERLNDQFSILLEGLPFLEHFSTYILSDEHAKLSHIRAGFQELMTSIAAVICSSIKNMLNGDTAMQQSTTEHSNLVRKMNRMSVEAKEVIYLVSIKKIGCESPKTNQLGALSSILENWKEMMECESDLIIIWKEQFQMIHKNLVALKSFIESSSNGSDESQSLCSSIVDAGHMAEYLLCTFSFGTCPVQCTSQWISELMKHVKVLTESVMEVNKKKRIMKIIGTTKKERSHISVQALRVPSSTDVVVGFEKEMALIRDRLSGHQMQLDVISIIGMPGLGKTTLARKAYEDRYTVDHFDVRAWCSVTQEYNEIDMLLTILGCISQLTEETRRKNVTDLSVMVHKELMGRRYLVVLDDIWKIDEFMRIKLSFPDDCTGSRILLTSRSKQIGLDAKVHSDSIEPGLLTDEESWDLLQQKIYKSKEMCPDELCPFGKEIAKKCKGLPLSVVVVGGVLKKSSQNLEFWEQVLGNLNSHLAQDSQSQIMASLELSYKYLPDCLKPMFLYFGAFPEDMEIPVKKLMRLWVAEGFVRKTELSSLEDHAERNLMDLIDRSLVMVAKKKWDGRVKACLIHDLLRDMCIVKAKEEKFILQVHVQRELPRPVMYQRRLSIIHEYDYVISSRHLVAYTDLSKISLTAPIYSLLFFNVGQRSSNLYRYQKGIESVISSLKLLKVFDADIFQVSQDVLDKDLTLLLGLKYVSFEMFESNVTIPPAISRLRSLETLIIKKRGTANVPETIWEMTKLRHLHIDFAKFSAEPENSFILENLQTFSTLCIGIGGPKIFGKVPALKQLRCILKMKDEDTQQFQLPDFESLDKLESLNVSIEFNTDRQKMTSFKFPLTLRKLKISGSGRGWNQNSIGLSWSEISILKTLPNLEFLQLSGFDNEEAWDMGDDDVFTNLKFLKLKWLGIKRWSASSSSENFPCLEKLVLDDCRKLEDIPSDLGEINSLQKIDVIYCASSLVKLVKEIQEEQEDYGNDSLQFYYKTIQLGI